MLQGIHYTERSRPPAPIRRPREGLTVSTSFHELAQLRAGWGDLDYAFLSPVADSISKSGYGAAFEEAAIGAALATATVPVVALGGARRLCAARRSEAHRAGPCLRRRSTALALATLQGRYIDGCSFVTSQSRTDHADAVSSTSSRRSRVRGPRTREMLRPWFIQCLDSLPVAAQA